MNIPKYFRITVVLIVSLQFLFYFVYLTDLSAEKQPSSSTATKEELPGTIISVVVNFLSQLIFVF